MTENEEKIAHSIDVGFGGGYIRIAGEDPEKVKGQFDEIYDRLLDDASDSAEAFRLLDNSTR